MRDRNINPKACLQQSEDGESAASIGGDDPSSSSNIAAQSDVPQYCYSPQDLEQQANTSVTSGDASTSSSNLNSLVVSVIGQDNVAPFHYSQEQQNNTNDNVPLAAERRSSSLSSCDKIPRKHDSLIKKQSHSSGQLSPTLKQKGIKLEDIALQTSPSLTNQ